MSKKSPTDRFLEKIPPIITWGLILFPLWGGFFFPEATAYIVIVFNVYFLYKSISFSVFFLVAFYKLRQSEAVNWLNKLKELEDIETAKAKIVQQQEQIKQFDYQELQEIAHHASPKNRFRFFPHFIQQLIFRWEREKAAAFLQSEIVRLDNIAKRGLNFDWRDLHQVVIIPHWKEPYSVLKDTLENIKQANYPANKINVVLGAEARDPEGYDKSVKLKEEYGKYFENIWISSHELTEEEIIGKSSNMAAAGKVAKAEIAKLGWDLKSVIITSCDADSLLPKDYFACLAFKYVTIDDFEYKYYNAAILFYANIWNLPFYARVKNSMSSLFNLSKLSRPDRFVPFSTYSVSFWLVDQIGYWTPWVTPEDYHLFFKGLFKFPEKVSTVPIYQRIMSDAAEGEGHIDTIKNTYFQSRRWSWGVSDDGWAIKQTIKLTLQGKMSLFAIYKVAHVIFDHILGTVITIIITLGGNLPLLINRPFSGTVLGLNLPRVSSFMLRISIWFLLILILFDHFLVKPEHPDKKQTILGRIFGLIEWIVFPYAGFILVILPGIEAHTRLLFGKYLEYYLTKKK